MDKDLAMKIIDCAEDLNDSPNSFIIQILKICECTFEDYPIQLERINKIKENFSNLFDKLYSE